MSSPLNSLGWKTVTLKDVAADIPNAIVDGPFGSNLKTDDYVESGVPVLQGKNVTNDAFRWFDVRYVSEKKASELTRSSVRPGDLLLVKIGSIGYSAIVDSLNGYDFAIIPANLVKVTPNSEVICTRYLHQWLTSPSSKSYLIGKASKTAQPALSLGKIKELPVPLPPLHEQRRIAAILDKAEALRTKRREALAQLDRLAQSIFVEMFGDLFTNSKGFPVSRLGDACDVRDGTHDSPAYVAVGCPLVTSKNLRDGKIDLSDINFISETDYNEINRRSKVDIGDILMPMIGTIGNPVLVEEEPSFAIKNMALIKFKPTSPCREFVLQFLHSDCFDRLIVTKNKGGTQKFLALGEIRGLPLPVPSEASQVEFSKRIRAINRKRTRYEDALDGTAGLFASLQHRAFRGEL